MLLGIVVVTTRDMPLADSALIAAIVGAPSIT